MLALAYWKREKLKEWAQYMGYTSVPTASNRGMLFNIKRSALSIAIIKKRFYSIS